jgi:hypothetical protein
MTKNKTAQSGTGRHQEETEDIETDKKEEITRS